MNGYFVSGTGTGVGKTIVSATLALSLKYDYWKPIQCGELAHSDSMNVSRLTQNKLKIHTEAHRLKTPASPHHAAMVDHCELRVTDIVPPETNRPIIVEGAGGLLVPINDKETIADLAAKLGLPLILVCKHYLGSINHTLLSISEIQRRELPLAGIIFVGNKNEHTENIIKIHSKSRVLGRLPWVKTIDSTTIGSMAKKVKSWKI